MLLGIFLKFRYGVQYRKMYKNEAILPSPVGIKSRVPIGISKFLASCEVYKVPN